MDSKKKTDAWMSNFLSKMSLDMARGGLVGCFTITLVTPLMNATNYILAKNNQKIMRASHVQTPSLLPFTWRRAFDGLLAYNASVVPMIGVSLTFNGLFMQHSTPQRSKDNKQFSDSYSLFSSVVSGAAAGSVGALPEGIAQIQQRSMTPKPKVHHVLQDIIHNNGYIALTRGMGATMMRQPIFTVGYINLMPMLSEALHEKLSDRNLSEGFASIFVGLLIGTLTAPFNSLRFQRQLDFHKETKALTYKEIYQSAQASGNTLGFFMKGAAPRSLMTAASMYLLHKGKEVYDNVLEEQSPSF